MNFNDTDQTGNSCKSLYKKRDYSVLLSVLV